MALTGRQKAAMLLMSLDATTAAELLKGVDAEVVQELALEVAYLDAAGYRSSKQSDEITRQFCSSLREPDVSPQQLSEANAEKYNGRRESRADSDPNTGFAV